MALLGVNIDHVATVRQARRAAYPDPVAAAAIAEMGGADQITVHLRGDRRHIQDRDLELLVRTVQTRLNVELAPTEEMVAIAARLRPHQVTLVPERPGEITTEGGLDLTVEATRQAVAAALAGLAEAGIATAIFADPERSQIAAVAELGCPTIELNTAAYAEAQGAEAEAQLDRLRKAARAAQKAGLRVAAGHGLHYHNVAALADLDLIEEFNIGHAIVARALFSGLEDAVRDMKALIE